MEDGKAQSKDPGTVAKYDYSALVMPSTEGFGGICSGPSSQRISLSFASEVAFEAVIAGQISLGGCLHY